MRLLLSRGAGLVGMLILAAAVAESAPAQRAVIAQFASGTPDVIAQMTADDPLPHSRRAAGPTPVATAPATSNQGAAAATPPARQPAAPTPHPPARVSIGTGQWGLINQDRAANGLAPLQWSPCLAAVATQNAARMAAQGYISHANGPSLDLGCHLDSRAGENVGWISSGINDAQMNALFMASPVHRANILGPYRYVGVAWVVAPSGAAYIAVEFS